MATASYTHEQERENLIVSFLPLVRRIAGRIAINAPSYLESEDLDGAGIIGLISAVDSYDPTRGTALKTYVFTRVKGAILDKLRKVSFIPRSCYDKVKVFQKKFNKLQSELQRIPTIDELAQHLSMTYEELDEVLSALRGISFLSIDQKNGQGEEATSILSLLSCPKSHNPLDLAEENERKEILAAAIDKLPEREKKIIVLYYFQGLLLKEISEILGVAPSRVSHLHSRALYRLNCFLQEQ